MKSDFLRILTSLLLTGAPIPALSQPKVQPTPRLTTWTCELTALLTNQSNTPSQKIFSKKLDLVGRGLISCKNQHGFSTDVPIVATLQGRQLENETEDSYLSIKTTSFSVPRDLNHVFDSYSARILKGAPEEKSLIQGKNFGNLIEIDVSGPQEIIKAMPNAELKLAYDSNSSALE